MAPQQEGKLERRIDPFLLLVQSSSSDDALDAILFSSMLLLFSDRTKGTNGSSILQWEELKMSLRETIGPDQFVMSSSFHSSTHSQMIIVIISSFFHHQSPRQFH